ncbi:MAG: cyanophycinase [Cyclobacteriaceae bacterium]
MKKIIFPVLLVGCLTCTGQQSNDVLTTGPENGTLVVVGGGTRTPGIMGRFIELAGGVDANIVVIPTASGQGEYDEESIKERWKEFGATNVTVRHTSSKEVANSSDFTQPIKTASAVWFDGGRQWRLVDSYANTETEKLFWEILDRGGVIGGSSAGATIQGSYLARGDTKNNQIMMGDHEEGFGFIKNIAIDQHVIARNRQFDLFDILKNRPELLGIGLDESTAIVVQGDQFEVLGESYVLIYDQAFWSREGSDLKNLPPSNQQFYFLREGDKYDMRKRQVIEE